MVDMALGTADVIRDAVIYFYIAMNCFLYLKMTAKLFASARYLKKSIDTLERKEKDTPR